MRSKKLLIQFLKYSVVGCVAFVADFLTLTLVYRVLLTHWPYGLFAGTAAGFVVGTVVNYGISKKMVFQQAASRAKKVVTEFLGYALVGLIGLLLTELGMYLGVEMLACHYGFTKTLVSGLVLIWNFLARRFLVYR